MQIVESAKRWLESVDRGMSRHRWYRAGRNSLLALNQRDGQRKAAAITYFAVFSIFPLFLLLISLLSFFLDSQEAQQRVINQLSQFMPEGTTGVRAVLESVIEARGAAAGFGIVLLLWGTLGWFESIDRAVNEMWMVDATRSFVRGKLFALGMIAALGLVILLSWVADIAVSIAMAFATDLVGGVALLWELAIALVTLALMALAFLLLYRFSPMCNLSWRDVWRGALATAALWTVLRSAFAIYITNFANYSSAYGPIAAVIVFLVWLYLAHNIILFGAALTYTLRLEMQGIHELRDLRCAIPRERGVEGRHERRRAS